MNFRKQTKAIAFADDLLIAVKAESIREAENITNIEMNKILNWAKNKKSSSTNRNPKLWLYRGGKEKKIKKSQFI